MRLSINKSGFGVELFGFAISLERGGDCLFGEFGRLQFTLQGKLPKLGQNIHKETDTWTTGRSYSYAWEGGSLSADVAKAGTKDIPLFVQ